MTRVYGFATNPDPIVGVLVYASLIPEDVLPPPDIENVDEVNTDATGRWELDLQPTTAAENVFWRIRVWQYGTFWVDVPDTADLVLVDDIIIEPAPPVDPPPQAPSVYVMRTELAKPGGVATLDSSGILATAQRPSGSGGPGGETVDWFFGDGPPGVVPGAALNDLYVDRLTGDLYKLS